MEKLSKLIGIVTTEEDLCDHNSSQDLNMRIINTVSGSSIMGIILHELDDSFLVGLPSKLMEYENKRVVEPHIPLPFTRMFKTTILSIIPCFGEFEIFYIGYMLSEGRGLNPDLVEELEPELIERMKVLKELVDNASKSRKKREEKTKDVVDTDSDVQILSSVLPPAGSKLKH